MTPRASGPPGSNPKGRSEIVAAAKQVRPPARIIRTGTDSGVQARGPFQVMPSLSVEEYDALRADIAKHGMSVPVLVDERQRVVDGHHRKRIAAELGIQDYPVEIIVGRTDEQLRDMAYRLNIHRRHLTRDQRAELVAGLRADGMSVRKIAEVTGLAKSTVDRDLARVPDGTGGRVTGSDGKSYPATKPPVSAKVAAVRDYFRSDREAADALAMADVGEEEFAAALAAAKADGDLSRENVMAKLERSSTDLSALKPAASARRHVTTGTAGPRCCAGPPTAAEVREAVRTDPVLAEAALNGLEDARADLPKRTKKPESGNAQDLQLMIAMRKIHRDMETVLSVLSEYQGGKIEGHVRSAFEAEMEWLRSACTAADSLNSVGGMDAQIADLLDRGDGADGAR